MPSISWDGGGNLNWYELVISKSITYMQHCSRVWEGLPQFLSCPSARISWSGSVILKKWLNPGRKKKTETDRRMKKLKKKEGKLLKMSGAFVKLIHSTSDTLPNPTNINNSYLVDVQYLIDRSIPVFFCNEKDI